MHILYENAKTDSETARNAQAGPSGAGIVDWSRCSSLVSLICRKMTYSSHTSQPMMSTAQIETRPPSFDASLEEHRVLHARDGLVALDGGGEDRRRRSSSSRRAQILPISGPPSAPSTCSRRRPTPPSPSPSSDRKWAPGRPKCLKPSSSTSSRRRRRSPKTSRGLSRLPSTR